jgi:hypothetical protein
VDKRAGSADDDSIPSPEPLPPTRTDTFGLTPSSSRASVFRGAMHAAFTRAWLKRLAGEVRPPCASGAVCPDETPTTGNYSILTPVNAGYVNGAGVADALSSASMTATIPASDGSVDDSVKFQAGGLAILSPAVPTAITVSTVVVTNLDERGTCVGLVALYGQIDPTGSSGTGIVTVTSLPVVAFRRVCPAETGEPITLTASFQLPGVTTGSSFPAGFLMVAAAGGWNGLDLAATATYNPSGLFRASTVPVLPFSPPIPSS